VLAIQAVKDIAAHLPRAYENGRDLDAREGMLNASMLAGLAFTNVSLGIVHSIAHTVGSFFHVPHGLADAIALPYVIEFNDRDERANGRYLEAARALGAEDLAAAIRSLNAALSIPSALGALIPDAGAFRANMPEMVRLALADGCTKTNPVIPTEAEMTDLITRIYTGNVGGNAE
jgi:alcohol dehydrogenase class IV